MHYVLRGMFYLEPKFEIFYVTSDFSEAEQIFNAKIKNHENTGYRITLETWYKDRRAGIIEKFRPIKGVNYYEET